MLSTRAMRALRGGRVDEAKALARRALEVAPDDPEVLRAASEISWALGAAAATAMLIERAIAHKNEPAPTSWQLLLARARAREGKTDDAVRAYRAALVSGPDDVDGWRELARAMQSSARRAGHDCRVAARGCARTSRLGSPERFRRRTDGARRLGKCRNRVRGRPAHGSRRTDRCREPCDPRRAPRSGGRCRFRARSVQRTPPGVRAGSCGTWLCLARTRALRRRSGCAAPRRHAFARRLDLCVRAFAGAPRGRVCCRSIGRRARLSGAPPWTRRSARGRGAGAHGARRCGSRRTVTRPRLLRRAHRTEGARGLREHLGVQSSARRARLDASHTAPLSRKPRHEGRTSFGLAPRFAARAGRRFRGSVALRGWQATADAPGARGPSLHPRPSAGRLFNIWGVVLEKGGHQTPHIHPSAWLSGVYYARVPEAIGSEAPDGWLEFGGADCPFPSLSRTSRPARPSRRGIARAVPLVLLPSHDSIRRQWGLASASHSIPRPGCGPKTRTMTAGPVEAAQAACATRDGRQRSRGRAPDGRQRRP